MAMSQQVAAAVALRQLGYHVVVHPNGVLVNQIDPRDDAAGKLQPTDVIVAVERQADADAGRRCKVMAEA